MTGARFRAILPQSRTLSRGSGRSGCLDPALETWHMSVDKATVRHIAQLARIAVAVADLEPLAGELDNILTWIGQLEEVDTDQVPPMTSAVATTLRRRADVVTDGERQEEVLANAPDASGGFFVVPTVVE